MRLSIVIRSRSLSIIHNKYLKTLICVFLSALLQSFCINVFITPAKLLSSGFTGLAILINKISSLFGFTLPVSLLVLMLNIPLGVLSFRSIGKKFVFFSILQVVLMSLFLNFHYTLLFDDLLLNVCFGGFLYGIAISLALRGNASTAGTDFIALWVSNKIGKSIFEYVFVFNSVLLLIFGYMFGWKYAGYSILFQFISTKTIDSFYKRYKLVTLEITTYHPKEICKAYIKHYRHGLSEVAGIGGYEHKNLSLIHTVISFYELEDAIRLINRIDPKAIINVISTERFVGHFYRQLLD
ncbi:YitT family protein [Sharpea azabuensis]|uniref:YitT family protein n=1 Tax=Sharpea azabuensis TaxID=322505 RepID=UPI0015696F24|nr:YitT family protein [Sharpea azabuensis]